jgi:hypothetical protein
LSDRIVHVHGISPIVQAQKAGVVGSHRAYRFGDSGKARIPISVLLSKTAICSGGTPRTFIS